MDWYENAAKERLHFTPQQIGVKQIEHFGFFKSKFAQTLWPEATKWLNK